MENPPEDNATDTTEARDDLYLNLTSRKEVFSRMDPFVAYRFDRAVKCYRAGLYEEAILQAGLALEEHLFDLYKLEKNPQRLFLGRKTRKPVDPESLDLMMLYYWAVHFKVIEQAPVIQNMLYAASFVRMFYPYPRYELLVKMHKAFDLDISLTIPPPGMTFPDWFQRLYDLAGTKKRKRVGVKPNWLFNWGPAGMILQFIFNLIEDTTKPKRKSEGRKPPGKARAGKARRTQ